MAAVLRVQGQSSGQGRRDLRQDSWALENSIMHDCLDIAKTTGRPGPQARATPGDGHQQPGSRWFSNESACNMVPVSSDLPGENSL